MKYFCLDRDSCGYTKKLNEMEFKKENFSNPFRNCIQCNYYMVIVPDDFSLESYQDILSGIIATKKIYEKEKENDTT